MSPARDRLQVPEISRGEVAEWSKAAVLKTARVQALEGSNPSLSANQISGEMAERLKAHAWKACVPKGTVGSNPTLSATSLRHFRGPPTGPLRPILPSGGVGFELESRAHGKPCHPKQIHQRP